MTLRLESNISIHPFTGYRDDGRVLCEVNTFTSALKFGAKYVRNNETKRIYTYGPAGRLRLIREVVEHVNACLSCRSLEHRTYAKECPRKVRP